MSLRAFNTLFPDEAAARGWFEHARWPHGPQCPSCGAVNEAIAALRGFIRTEVGHVLNALVAAKRPAALVLERLDF